MSADGAGKMGAWRLSDGDMDHNTLLVRGVIVPFFRSGIAIANIPKKKGRTLISATITAIRAEVQ